MDKLSTLLAAIDNHLNTSSNKTDIRLFTIFIAKHLPIALSNLPLLIQELIEAEDKSDTKEEMLYLLFEAEKAIKKWMDEHGHTITEALEKE